MKRIAIILNPISGRRKVKDFPALLKKYLDHQVFNADIMYWTREDSAYELAMKAIASGYDMVVAAGGDGTINQVGSALKHTGKPMGIIPLGSGNGLARHLRISLDPAEAIRNLNRPPHAIDTMTLNEHTFINVAGAGFDAFVGDRFARAEKRGFMSYVRETVKSLRGYKPEIYQLLADGILLKGEMWMISFANGSQWGNNAKVSPNASVNDGLIDVIILGRIKFYQIPGIVFRLFTGSFDRSPVVKLLRCREARLIRGMPGIVHVDGEPLSEGEEIRVKVEEGSLMVVGGSRGGGGG